MKRAFALYAAAVYVAALLWGMTGAGAALIAGAVLFVLAFPKYVQVDPYDTRSALDELDGRGVSA